MSTVADLLLARVDDDAPGIRHLDRSWSWAEAVGESRRRAEIIRSWTAGGGEPHVGVLLDNSPEYLFWLGAAALTGWVVVGINPTRRGEDLARDIRFTSCAALVTDAGGAELTEGLDLGIPADRVLRVDSGGEGVAGSVAPFSPSASVPVSSRGSSEEREGGPSESSSLYLLLFTSGTTAAPKAVRCTQGRLAAIATRVAELHGFRRDDVCYCPMPLFHGNAVMSLWAPAMAAGACVAVGGRFSASRFSTDVERYRASRFTYVGKALAYILASPERPVDAGSTLRFGFGTEASARDRDEFQRRFGCVLVEGYGSSEGGLSVNRTVETPPGALGPAGDDVLVMDRDGAQPCERARIGPDGRVVNAAAATGEIVNLGGASGFEGYWRQPEADAVRVRDGGYWTGDLGYIDESGFLWFAGRRDDWLRVDSENLGAAPIERLLERHPLVTAAAVYAVPDVTAGDQVMAAVELHREVEDVEHGDASGGEPADRLARFGDDLWPWLAAQADLGTKWAPRFVRVMSHLPLGATGKVTKAGLRAEGWWNAGTVFFQDRRTQRYRLLTAKDREALLDELAHHDRLPATLDRTSDAEPPVVSTA